VLRDRLKRNIGYLAEFAGLAGGARRGSRTRLAMLRAPESPLALGVVASPNFEARAGGALPDMIVLHYTGMADADQAVQWLTNTASRVSAHYFVYEDGTILQMVSEQWRAWHAGQSFWAGEADINSVSIGIEVHNLGHDAPDGLPAYPQEQMDAVAALCCDVAGRWAIPPARVVAHSDVAPGRKRDPGEHFDWQWLAEHGVGIWVSPVPPSEDAGFGPGDEGGEIASLKARLAQVGYGVTPGPAYDDETQVVVAAFQRRFRPARVDGCADSSTCETLDRLLAALEAQEVG